ncbi:uncharacterized protein LOC110857531 [Folsomia candida]|uniref:uncharacterized protein LOC110857531 n=1 Tax=Folsomia candida TaxID=158441 RepID=UPI000B8F1FED|nr:uncharacterized protein LOC110857531 [Folsomia candida]
MEGEDAIILEPRSRFCHSCRQLIWGTSCCGRVTPEGDADMWQQYSVLPYLEDQKYTFGSKYTSREEQGEFIFVRTTKNPGNLAEITCSGGNYWITPASKRVVLVNDDRLKKNCRTRLNYGDKIALLGKVRPRRGLNGELKHESLNGFFLFKEGRRAIERQDREDPNIPDNEEKVAFTPGQNYLVLSHIFSYLPFDTLKEARLVCSLWDEEASRILKNKSTIIMSFYFQDNYEDPMGSMRLLRYVKEMENLQPTSLTLHLPTVTPANYPTSKGEQLVMKLVDDLNWFLRLDRCRHITRLNLGGRIFLGSDYKIHLDILVKLQSTLCDLELSWHLHLRDESSDDYAFPTEDLHLDKLAVFTVSIATCREGAANQAIILSSWAAAVQRVKTIQLNYDVRHQYKFVNCLLQYEQPFPQLEAFTITTWTRPSVLNLLLKLTNPLKTLKLNRLRCFERREDFINFENLLQKHAGTLEELGFIYDVPYQDEVDIEVESWTTLHLPVLPRLKTLSVGWNAFGHLKIGFPSGQDNNDVLDYERHLPRLDALSLSMFPSSHPFTDSWEGQQDKLDIFFPTRDRNGAPIETRCVTLRKLEPRIYVPCAGRPWSKIEFPSDLPLTDMFPNVWNNWMTRRRNEES